MPNRMRTESGGKGKFVVGTGLLSFAILACDGRKTAAPDPQIELSSAQVMEANGQVSVFLDFSSSVKPPSADSPWIQVEQTPGITTDSTPSVSGTWEQGGFGPSTLAFSSPQGLPLDTELLITGVPEAVDTEIPHLTIPFSTTLRTTTGEWMNDPHVLDLLPRSSLGVAVDGLGNVVLTGIDSTDKETYLETALFNRETAKWSRFDSQDRSDRYSVPIVVNGRIHLVHESVDTTVEPEERYVVPAVYDPVGQKDGNALVFDGTTFMALQQRVLPTDPVVASAPDNRLICAFFEPMQFGHQLVVSRRNSAEVPCPSTDCWETEQTGVWCPDGLTIGSVDVVYADSSMDQIAVVWSETNPERTELIRVAWHEGGVGWLDRNLASVSGSLRVSAIRVSWSPELIVYWRPNDGSSTSLCWRKFELSEWSSTNHVEDVLSYDVVGRNDKPLVVALRRTGSSNPRDHIVVWEPPDFETNLAFEFETAAQGTGLFLKACRLQNGVVLASCEMPPGVPPVELQLLSLDPWLREWQILHRVTGGTGSVFAGDSMGRVIWSYVQASGKRVVDRWELPER